LFEEENCHIAREALNALTFSFQLDQQSIAKGLEARQPCRFEKVPGIVPIILDVAHNPDGIQHLFQMIDHAYSSQPIRILFGLSKNKDVHSCLELISTKGTHFHLIEAANGRGVSTNDLYDQLKAMGVHSEKIFKHQSIQTGVCQAQAEASKHGEILLICGSFFIMSEVRRALRFDEPSDAIDLNERNTAIKN